MCKTKFQYWIISIVLSAFSFVIIYDTVCILLKNTSIEISYTAEEENSKTEKEKEKESEQDEVNELFIENFFLSVSEKVILLNYSPSLSVNNIYTRTFYSEIVPPPPKF